MNCMLGVLGISLLFLACIDRKFLVWMLILCYMKLTCFLDDYVVYTLLNTWLYVWKLMNFWIMQENGNPEFTYGSCCLTRKYYVGLRFFYYEGSSGCNTLVLRNTGHPCWPQSMENFSILSNRVVIVIMPCSNGSN